MFSTSATRRSSISPFRSRKPPHPPPNSSLRTTTTLVPKQTAPTTPSGNSKENVTVTVRFRPLSAREINKGDEVAWYADGDCTVRNEYNSDIAYGFDRVFGPATTTRQVYDVAAQHVVGGAMEGINGTVFAYGVTSSGKTHTMHGEQKSPGIIPLAVKDVFGIIQETPGREFLLRVSYLEIYNEVINDLLNPTGQNLRIREDSQGTYVEGIKEEVVLSPAHALSLIASGEEHRHVGSNNFNLLSSRSHTIFTLTIESSLRVENEEVTLSHLHLIDLAGSESSKTETTGLRRKEGSYINKSLLTLGTVISKLTDGKSSHIPYRDSKLTRLLQSSLSGSGRVSLVCTVTPASSNTEETHNTLKFAQRSKQVEIKASQNKILDEKSLIKKYQREIYNLKQELQQLKHGMMEKENLTAPSQEDLVNLKLQLEAGQVKLQSRLEEEEQAKAALIGRIQRLTKLILVSTKTSIQSNISDKPSHRRRHSFGEDELVYLPGRKRECIMDNEAGSMDSESAADCKIDATNLDELVSDYKRNKKGVLSWFKLKNPDNVAVSPPNADCESSASGSPASSSNSSQRRVMFSDIKDGHRKSVGRKADASFPERTQAGDLFSAATGVHRQQPTGSTITDQMDLLREQIKMLAGEVALSSSSLKRLSEQAANNLGDTKLQEHIQKLKDEIREKKLQMRLLEQRMIGSVEIAPYGSSVVEMSQALSRLATQLNEKTFELEIKSADNRVLQEQLRGKTTENVDLKETITLLRKQLDSSMSNKNSRSVDSTGSLEVVNERGNDINLFEETSLDGNAPASVRSLNGPSNHVDDSKCNTFSKCQLFSEVAEIELESLKQDKLRLTEEKDGLEIHCRKQIEEASYAKELAAAAAVELRNLAEEVTKLSYQNAKLTADLAAATDVCCKANCCKKYATIDTRQNGVSGSRPGSDSQLRKTEHRLSAEEFEMELSARYQREASLVAALSERDKIEADLRKRLDEAKWHEEKLESELANMWVLVAKMRKTSAGRKETPVLGHDMSNILDTKFLLSNRQQIIKSNENMETGILEDATSVKELQRR